MSWAELYLSKQFTGSRVEILSTIGVQTDELRCAERLRQSVDGENAKWMQVLSDRSVLILVI